MTPQRLAAAYALDIFAGDPEWFPHPVRFFGTLISAGERVLRPYARTPANEMLAGALLTGFVVSTAWIAGVPTHSAWHIALGWTTLATRSLLQEAGAVIRALDAGDIGLARARLARIVGRDTEHLDEGEIARAVIETLAESACDGIVAPIFWLAAGGLPAAMAYKAVNTLDSMIGHPEPPYRYFGRAAARLDDAANFVSARLTAIAIAVAGGMCSRVINQLQSRDHKVAFALRIWWRDGDKHASPNAGQCEAAMAGALGVRLGGTNFYDGQRHDGPVLNAEGRGATVDDARAALSIVAVVSGIAFGAALLVLACRRPHRVRQ